MNRRKFLATCTGAAAVSSVMRPLAQASARLPIKKAVEFEMLPKGMSVADRLQMARDAGFAEVECPTMPDEHEAEEVKKAAEKTGLRTSRARSALSTSIAENLSRSAFTASTDFWSRASSNKAVA